MHSAVLTNVVVMLDSKERRTYPMRALFLRNERVRGRAICTRRTVKPRAFCTPHRWRAVRRLWRSMNERLKLHFSRHIRCCTGLWQTMCCWIL